MHHTGKAFLLSYPCMNEFLERFYARLDPDTIRQLARQTGWSQRQGKIDPFEFVAALSAGQASALHLTLNAQAQCYTQPVRRQAVDQRYHAKAVTFFQAVFNQVLTDTVADRPAHPQAEPLGQHFTAVYLADSTCFDCPESLHTLFPACGGAGSAANVKVLLRYEYLHGQLEPQALLPGKKSDQGLAVQIAQLLHAGELQIQDKGFYDSAAWRIAQERHAFLLMPWVRRVGVRLRADHRPESLIELASVLKASPAARVEWEAVWLGKGADQIGPVRMVAFRLSEESANRQRQSLREKLRRQGKTPTAEALELAGWLILITNAPVAKLPTAVLAYVYRVRWQVELIFRQCKDTLRLDQAQGDNEARTQCEIWARLLYAVLIFAWHTHANADCWHRQRREISFEKVARLFQHYGLTLARAWIHGGQHLRELLRELWQRTLITTLKERCPSAPTTWEDLMDHWLDLPTSAEKVTPQRPANLR